MIKSKTTKTRKQNIDNTSLNDPLFLLGDKNHDEGNFTIALKLFLEAANNGFVLAMSRVGYAYDVGLGTRKN